MLHLPFVGRLPTSYAARLIALLVMLTGFLAGPAQAQLQLRIGGGNFQPMPIAIADFGGDPSLGGLVSGVVTNNLRRSGYFTPLEHARFPEQPNFDAAPNFEKWRGACKRALLQAVQGIATKEGN